MKNLIDDERYGPMLRNLNALVERSITTKTILRDHDAEIARRKALRHPVGANLVVKADGKAQDVPSIAEAVSKRNETARELFVIESAIAQQMDDLRRELPAASSRICRTILPKYLAIMERIIKSANDLSRAVAEERRLVSQLESAGIQCVAPIVQPGIEPWIFGEVGGTSRLAALIQRAGDAKETMRPTPPATIPTQDETVSTAK